MLHRAIQKYKPLADRLDQIFDEVGRNGFWQNGNYWQNTHIPSTPEEVEAIRLTFHRANQVSKLIMECLGVKEVECINTGSYRNGLHVFFVHNGRLIHLKFNCHGLYTINWKEMIEILEAMETIYAGP